MAIMTERGVASPSAQGQAITSTDTALTVAKPSDGSGPNAYHRTKVAAATSITAGTNRPATRSTVRWMGSLLPCARCTISTIRDNTVSAPTRVASTVSAPVPFTAPPTTSSPGPLATGRLSPVSIDSSTSDTPARTTPSIGTRAPGRTRSRSPGLTRDTGTVSIPSSVTRSAVSGARSNRALSARLVLPLARDSIAWPRTTRVITTATASKKGRALPSGKRPGRATAAIEKIHAAPVPSATSVSMFAAPLRASAQAPV